ncbi:37725_t:CDS:1, partial [Gigaspora margarita]
IEPEFNNVVIYLSMDDGKNKEFIENVETFNPSPIIKLLPNEENEEILLNSSTLVEKRNLDILVNGGSKIVSVDQDNRRIRDCSAGFWMKNYNEDFIVTAGHCSVKFPSLFYVYSFQDDHFIGPMNSRVIGLYDMGFIKKTNTNIMLRPVIRQFDHINLRFLQFLIVGSSEITICGIHICKSGQSTGISCGFVSAFNSVEIVDGQPMMRTIVAPINNYRGDSGGSVFRYNGHNADAVGIAVAGFPSHLLLSLPISLAYEL